MSSSFDLMGQAAVAGRGVALARGSLAADDLAKGDLVRPFILSLPVEFAYYVVSPVATADRPKAAAFWQWGWRKAAVGTVISAVAACRFGGGMMSQHEETVESRMTPSRHNPLRTVLLPVAWLLLATPADAVQSPKEILDAVVRVQSTIPVDARTASTLGTTREGSGVVIDDEGLILTIGYLILEADSVTVTTRQGSSVDASIVAYDHATGFGLVRAKEPLEVSRIEFGRSDSLDVGDPVLAISSGGAEPIVATRVVSRRHFAGYWEYLLENAIFVSPPHRFFSGSALIGSKNELVGIGSLIVSNAAEKKDNTIPGNMFVPIDALKPVLQSLVTTGRDPQPRRPWIGVYTEEYRGHVFVTRVAEDSPALRAGVMRNDVILSVGDKPVSDLAALYRAMWALGEAGVDIPLKVLRKSKTLSITPKSTDRYNWLRLAPKRLTAIHMSTP